jgi:hypothetical protein
MEESQYFISLPFFGVIDTDFLGSAAETLITL